MTTQPTETTRPRPWQLHRERPARREGVRLDPPPDAQIDIYANQVVLTRRVNGMWRSYPVAPEGIAQALAGLPLSSGLLPPDTLGWGMADGEPYIVRYIAPHVASLRVLLSGTHKTYAFALPPLVWAGRAGNWRIWALNIPERPTHARVPLCNPPFPNSYATGGICWGSVDKPPAATDAQASDAALAAFLDSDFNTHVDSGKSKRYPSSILPLWKKLTRDKTPYPLNDLVETQDTLAWLLAGGPWGGGK